MDGRIFQRLHQVIRFLDGPPSGILYRAAHPMFLDPFFHLRVPRGGGGQEDQRVERTFVALLEGKTGFSGARATEDELYMRSHRRPFNHSPWCTALKSSSKGQGPLCARAGFVDVRSGLTLQSVLFSLVEREKGSLSGAHLIINQKERKSFY